MTHLKVRTIHSNKELYLIQYKPNPIKKMPRLFNATFSGRTGHPTNAAFSPLIFHNVHFGPNASNYGTTFLCSTHR